MRTGAAGEPSSGGDDERSAVLALVALARREAESGSLERAWQACREAADLGRRLGDPVVLAEAATAITGPSIGSWSLTASRQALCLEALGMLGDADPELTEVVAAQLAALDNAWAERSPAGPPGDPKTLRRDMLRLQAEHAAAGGSRGVGQRLDAATRLRALAHTAGDDGMLGWAHLWRLDAFRELGLGPAFHTELMALAALVERRGSPVWRWRLAAVHVALALMEDRLDDVEDLLRALRSAAAEASPADGPFVDLLLRSAIAERTGDGLDGVEVEVRRALANMPFLAQGWRAQLLLALGRHDEAVELWATIAPHLDEVPEASIEWVVVVTGHADLAIAAGDREAAARVREQLRPFAHLHVSASSLGEYGGPVALVLGRLAAFLGDPVDAAAWLDLAERRAHDLNAPWFARRAREARIGLVDTFEPLSPRETDIAKALAAGRTNREIAVALFLSERTVEQHVRHILRKLDLPNRAAVASWVTKRGR